ncbi:MAG: DUF1501 domain-containing protein [Rhodospirillaceae bacterium]
MTLSRRTLLGSAAAAGLMPLMPGLTVAFADTSSGQVSGNQVLVFLFLRFGMDGLSLLPPAEDGSYRDKRPTIALASSGPGAAIYLDTHQGVPFFLHPAARQMRDMYANKKLAIVHAAGVPSALRSHFEVQAMAATGVADNEAATTTGWLARHLLAKGGARSDFSAVSDGNGLTATLDGLGGTLSFSSLSTLGTILYGRFAETMAAMNAGASDYELSVQKATRVAGAVRDQINAMPPAAPNPNYTYGPLSGVLQPLAQTIKLDVGVELATADFGGWDHHEFLPNAFFGQAQELGNALYAFMDDLGEHANRVTVVMMTEFGRRAYENANNGTDHGAGAPMLLLGAGVNGGKMYGDWPGLKDNQLDQGDLPVTTDYRRVLAEVLVKRQGQTAIEQVFPTVPYAPLGVVS